MATTSFLLLIFLLFIVFFPSHSWLPSPGLPHQNGVPLTQEQRIDFQSRLSAFHFSRKHGVETARLAANQTVVSPSTRHKRTSEKARKWGFGILEGMAAGAASCVVFFAIMHFGKGWIMKHKKKGPVVFQRRISPKLLAFLEKEDAMETMELIGEGGAGQVYKTTLASGEVVAIKKVTPHIRDLMEEVDKTLAATKYSKQVLAELETLGKIRHRNLVSLLAYVPRPRAHLLIYEYMPKRSLQEALFAGRDEKAVAAGDSLLTWPIRHKIAVGTCEGLTYLHFHCTQRIVHRDLKPANILLDEDMEPHLGDFGLAKLLPDNDTHCTSQNVAGTFGFIAPEVYQTLRYTDKCDVYSFGVVLIVLLTGKKPSDQAFVDSTSIAAWARQLFHSENRMEALDPMLRAEKEEELMLALKVAVFCTATSPSERPTSKDALQMLRQIRPLQS